MALPPTDRDTRIDFIRGFFILMMAMDHFDYLVALLGSQVTTKVYTYQSIGWSSAAEFFVFFSGYIIAIVYAKTLATRGFWLTQLRAAHRAWELYVRNALVWLLAVASVALFFRGDQALLAVTQIARAAQYADAGLLEFMTMQYRPVYFEILPLYMVLMLLAPAFLWCHGRHRGLAIATSAALWLAVQIHPALNLYSPGPWNFNPFAWQFVFFLGMWFSKEKPLTGFNRDRRASKIAIAVGVLLLCAALKALDKAHAVLPVIGEIEIPGIGKSNVEPLRLLMSSLPRRSEESS